MFIDPDFSQVLIWVKCKSLGNVTAGIQGWPWEEWDHGMDERGGNILVLGCPKGQAGAPWDRERCPCSWHWVGFMVLSIPFWDSGILGFVPHVGM